MNECSCGCGTAIPDVDSRGRPRYVAAGHARRGKRLTPDQIARRTATRRSRGPYNRRGVIRHRAVPPEERFDRNYEVAPGGCWLWKGAPTAQGYGKFEVDGQEVLAHRYAHERFLGPIPSGYHVDHVLARGCTSRLCVNPAHLEAVTPAENARRARRNYCRRGHPLSGVNLRVSSGRRVCRACHRERARAAYNRRKR